MEKTSDLISGFRKSINFRDLGGYPAADGRAIREGLLFRSGGFSYMNEKELALLERLNVRFVLDLRTKTECAMYPDPPLKGATFLQHSGLEFANGAEIDFSPTGMNQIGDRGLQQLAVLRKYYSAIPFDNEAFRILMDNVAKQNAPIVFHCASGKDRTGVAAMILLLALGTPKDVVLEDYLLSAQYLAADVDRALEEKKEIIAAHPEARELTIMKAGVSEKIGREVLDAIHTRYGGVEAYLLNEYGLDRDRLSALRAYYCA